MLPLDDVCNLPLWNCTGFETSHLTKRDAGALAARVRAPGPNGEALLLITVDGGEESAIDDAIFEGERERGGGGEGRGGGRGS